MKTRAMVFGSLLATIVSFTTASDSAAATVLCRKGKKIVARDDACRGKEARVDTARTLGLVRLPHGQSQVIFQAGQLMLTARCTINDPLSGDIAVVHIATSQDGAAFDASDEQDNLTVATPEDQRVFAIASAPTGTPEIENQEATAIAPDGTILTGVLIVGVNVLSSPGECVFGGHLVVG